MGGVRLLHGLGFGMFIDRFATIQLFNCFLTSGSLLGSCNLLLASRVLLN